MLPNSDVQLDSSTDIFRFAPSQIVGGKGSEALLDLRNHGGVVNQNMEATQIFESLLNYAVYLSRIAQQASTTFCLDGLSNINGFFGLNACDDHAHAIVCQRQRDAFANSCSSAVSNYSQGRSEKQVVANFL